MLESPWAGAQTVVICGGSPAVVFTLGIQESPPGGGRIKQASDKCSAGDFPERIGKEAM